MLIDDSFPFDDAPEGDSWAFARMSKDDEYWVLCIEKAVAKAEHLLSQSKDTEAELRNELEATQAKIPVLQTALNEVRTSAKDDKRQIEEGNRLKVRGLTSEIEKRRFRSGSYVPSCRICKSGAIRR